MIFIVFFFFFQAEDGIRDVAVTGVQTCALPIFAMAIATQSSEPPMRDAAHLISDEAARLYDAMHGDRKSTRLNSSHGYISYAVFCLKKKNIAYSTTFYNSFQPY